MDADLSVTFLGPARMRQLNREHLGHDHPTDVISFALPHPDGTLAGDIYVCRHVAARQARDAAEPVRRELLRLVIHGTLHVLGWEHPEDDNRVDSPMWQLQERYLRELG
ncbi:MAG TPA: rRNA maturation RNase YbeY [Gemmatimonadales bacterium]|nr:rRNA maturation RNase YbeY [Gemmatimonadales bacterium]